MRRRRWYVRDHTRWLAALFLLVIASTAARVDAADDDKTAPAPTNKLTFAYYAFSSDDAGGDVNLRHTFASSTAWIGVYTQSDGFTQLRLGWEYDYHHGWLTLVPSAQLATHSFLGATLYSEMGGRLFAIAGAGRTNLNPYWNLGFDPNDYAQAGAGYRDAAGNTLSAYAIRDIRNGTGQTNTHLYARRRLSHDWRLTVDAVNEHGNGDDGLVVRSWAVSVDVDWREWFVRVAEDPHVNYTPDRQLRVAAGLRF